MSDPINPRELIHTQQGKKWLKQFDLIDQDIAILIANNLTLVSHMEFERNLVSKLEKIASTITGTIGFFAIRELNKKKVNKMGVRCPIPFYEQVSSYDGKSINAISLSADQGSEARVAHIIRQFCKSNPQKYLNHPTLETLKRNKSDAIIFVDDLIGSGGRSCDFLDAFMLEPTIVSWLSGKQIEFYIVAYSGIEKGINMVKKHKSKPQVQIYKPTPTFDSLPWDKNRKERVRKLCEDYGYIVIIPFLKGCKSRITQPVSVSLQGLSHL